jgi:hypothetical protein
MYHSGSKNFKQQTNFLMLIKSTVILVDCNLISSDKDFIIILLN